MNEDWSNTEIELIVSDYFLMLIDELDGIPINKTEHRRILAPLLNNRSGGSIEFKHQNISAVLCKVGIPFIKGYKPRYNYQKSLEEKTLEYLIDNQKLEVHFARFAEGLINPLSTSEISFENWMVTPPIKNFASEPPSLYQVKPVKVNYLEKEQQNRELGALGEKMVIQYEKWLLLNAGKESLADKIEWVSNEQGDGLGFDILSKNLNGTDKYIEVKTTKLTKEAPIFFTKNEFNFSIRNENNFHLYRLFNFSDSPKMFNVKGRYDKFCEIEAVQYKGYF